MISFLNFNNIIFYLLITAILLDIFLGSLRALKEKKWNSTVGINGILRKTAMIGSSIFLIIIDSILKIDLLFFIPKEITNILKLNEVGIFELFGIMFILYEITSILKNMVLCGLPIPKKIKIAIEKLLNNLTSETGGEKNE
ncbi:MAG: phage holin family protein [Bacilli bacterium]